MLTFNSREYTWCDLHTYMLGREVGGMRGIEYKKKKAKEALFGAGNTPRSIQHGKREYEGTITLLQSELIALTRAAKAAGYTDIMDIEFDVVVSYISTENIVITDRVVSVSITEVPRLLKEGDMKMEVALPFIALDVEENIN